MKNLLLTALLSAAALVPAFAQNTQVRPLAAFHAIKVGSGISLELTAGHSQRVEVSASSTEDRDRITTTVSNGTLVISYDRAGLSGMFHSSRQLRVAVTADQLTALAAGSGSSVESSGNIAAAGSFELAVSSGASLRAELGTAALTVRESSGSTVALSGHAASLDLQVGSGATFNGKNLQTDRCRAQASSGSSVRVAVKDDLVADASSGASVSYSGSPQVTKHVSSGGSVSGH
ncbi:hypothetical protein A0257_09380 [Hymenobacter psoromatis]|nr:hypothetical protein A0257_09380 [Hymenobacter psoromatis]